MTGRPRLGPISTEELAASDAELLSPTGPFPGAAGSNFFSTLARHPGLFRKWAPLGSKILLAGKLPARDREILILRTAWLCRCRYEWEHHAGALRSAGATAEEIRAVAAGPQDRTWDRFEGALLSLVDSLHSGRGVDDTTWAVLAERYDDKQLIEAIFVVGLYQTVAGFLLTLGVELEDDHPTDEGMAWPGPV